MRGDALLALVVVGLGGVGTWLMLPRRHGQAQPRQAHLLGGLMALAALLLLAILWTPPGAFLTSLFFYGFASLAIAGGVLMITTTDPVSSALWFAAVVLSTSGLFLLAGAQFLAAGTVIVYAGAIIVMFLFVIMLAQSSGKAAYDRAARMPGRATLCCFLLLWALLYSVRLVGHPEGRSLDANERAMRLIPTGAIAAQVGAARGDHVQAVLDRAVRAETARMASNRAMPPGVPTPHVAGLGGTLYTDHLITVEIAGAILFVALVGAAAIATPKPHVRPQPPAR